MLASVVIRRFPLVIVRVLLVPGDLAGHLPRLQSFRHISLSLFVHRLAPGSAVVGWSPHTDRRDPRGPVGLRHWPPLLSVVPEDRGTTQSAGGPAPVILGY